MDRLRKREPAARTMQAIRHARAWYEEARRRSLAGDAAGASAALVRSWEWQEIAESGAGCHEVPPCCEACGVEDGSPVDGGTVLVEVDGLPMCPDCAAEDARAVASRGMEVS